MRLTSLFILTLLGLTASAQARQPAPVPVVPASLQGIWMEQGKAGRAQCRDYLRAVKAKAEDMHVYLVGAEIVAPRGLHSFAEYGEGNFYRPVRIVSTGAQGWRIDARLGFDGPPSGSESVAAVLQLSLKAGQLTWKPVSIDGKLSTGRGARRYFRCASVTKGMYGT